MEINSKDDSNTCELQEIVEGQAKIKTSGKVFYNVVQEFNRDLRWIKEIKYLLKIVRSFI